MRSGIAIPAKWYRLAGCLAILLAVLPSPSRAQDGLPIDEPPTGASIAAAMEYNGRHAGKDLEAMPANLLLSGTWRTGHPVALKIRWPVHTSGDLALGFQAIVAETYELYDGPSVYSGGQSGAQLSTGFGIYGLRRWNQSWFSTAAGSYLLAMPGFSQGRLELGAGVVLWKRLRLELGPTYTLALTKPVSSTHSPKGIEGAGLQAQIGVDLDNQTVHQKSGLAMLTFANVGLLLLAFLLFHNVKVG